MCDADLATNFWAGMVDLACGSFSGEVYEMTSSAVVGSHIIKPQNSVLGPWILCSAYR